MLLLLLLLIAAPSIDGPATIEEHGLARLIPRDVPEKAGVLWHRPPPGLNVVKAGRELIATGRPGVYDLELLIVTTADGAITIDSITHRLTITPAAPQVPPAPPPAPPGKEPPPGALPPNKLADPAGALVRLRAGSSGCTATVIGPRRPDGKWDVLCAAHCFGGTSKAAQIQLKTGRILGVTLTTIDRRADIAWLVTNESVEALPYALLAPAAPPPGTKIWHAGYGVHVPGNREEGTVSGPINADGQLPMRLSVSSGDSGGGIFRVDTGELVANVCCTRSRSAFADVWGGSSPNAIKLRPVAAPDPSFLSDDFKWAPKSIPIVGEGMKGHR